MDEGKPRRAWVGRLFAAIFLLGAVCLGIWRYAAIPKPVAPFWGKVTLLELEATGVPVRSPYGFQTDVTLAGVPGVLYLDEESPIEPGDRIGGGFLI